MQGPRSHRRRAATLPRASQPQPCSSCWPCYCLRCKACMPPVSSLQVLAPSLTLPQPPAPAARERAGEHPTMHKGDRHQQFQPPQPSLLSIAGSDAARCLFQVSQPASVPGSSAGCTCLRRCGKCSAGEDCCCWQTPCPPQPRRACVHLWSNARLSERTELAPIGRPKQGTTQPQESGAQSGWTAAGCCTSAGRLLA